MLYGNEKTSSKLAIIDTKINKTLLVKFEDINQMILEKMGRSQENFEIKTLGWSMQSRSQTALRNEQLMTLIEEDKTNLKYLATFDVEMKGDEPSGLKCISF